MSSVIANYQIVCCEAVRSPSAILSTAWLLDCISVSMRWVVELILVAVSSDFSSIASEGESEEYVSVNCNWHSVCSTYSVSVSCLSFMSGDCIQTEIFEEFF